MPDANRFPIDPESVPSAWEGRVDSSESYQAHLDRGNAMLADHAARRRPSSGYGSQADLDALRAIKAMERPTAPRTTLDVELTGNLSPASPEWGIELPWIVVIPLLCLLIAVGAHSVAVWLSPLIWPQL